MASRVSMLEAGLELVRGSPEGTPDRSTLGWGTPGRKSQPMTLCVDAP